jgi:uncharacterized OB-fold protein
VLDGKCKLITFTQVFFAPPAFQPETPYLLGLAELTNGLRVFAPISPAVDKEQLKPGFELNLKVAKGSRDNLYYSLEYRTRE